MPVEGDPMSVRNYLVRKSQQAAKALAIFAQERDKDVLLERAREDGLDFSNKNYSLVRFLVGRRSADAETSVTLDMIDTEHSLLSGHVEQFQPNYEDPRF